MAYKVPTFPMQCNIYTRGTGLLGTPRLQSPCNLAYGRRVFVQFAALAVQGEPAIFSTLLLPAGTDIRDFAANTGRDMVEVPAGSSRAYTVDFVDDFGLGFANEHRFAIIEKLVPWPTPLQGVFNPGGGGGGGGLAVPRADGNKTVSFPDMSPQAFVQSGPVWYVQDTQYPLYYWTDLGGPAAPGLASTMALALTSGPPTFTVLSQLAIATVSTDDCSSEWRVAADAAIRVGSLLQVVCLQAVPGRRDADVGRIMLPLTPRPSPGKGGA